MLNAHDIKWLHVEASSKCNAWCPACPRNKNGYGLIDGLIEQDLLPSQFETIVSRLPSLQTVQFCGNYGDPIASSYIIDLVQIAKKHANKIQIHTNGSLRNTDWWRDFAQQLIDIDHNVWFGIDGLNEIHEIYRQGTDFDKIMANAEAFIKHGGHATWQFIPYQHNEHQVSAALKMSQKYKFKKFHVAKLYRQQTVARHFKTGQEFELRPTKSMAYLTNIGQKKQIPDRQKCMHLNLPSIYVSASGHISRCCYFADQDNFADVESFTNNAVVDLSVKKCIISCG